MLSDCIFSLVVKEFRFGGSGIGGKGGWRVGRGQGLILVSVSSNQTHLCSFHLRQDAIQMNGTGNT